MTIEVRLFANLARYLPAGTRGDAATLEIPEGATLADLVRRLAIPAGLPGLVLVNGHEATTDRPLRAGDVVTIVPPLAGGMSVSEKRAEQPAAASSPPPSRGFAAVTGRGESGGCSDTPPRV